MNDVFLEIVVIASDALKAGIESRDEIETRLEEALAISGLGEVTGGGGGSGVYIVDVEISSEESFGAALELIRAVLQALEVPPSTLIKRHKPQQHIYTVYV